MLTPWSYLVRVGCRRDLRRCPSILTDVQCDRAVSLAVVGVARCNAGARRGLPAANAQVTACPAAEGWTRLVVPPARRSNGDSVPPWEHEPPIDNGGPRRWLWAISGGWEAPGVVYVGGANRLYRSWDCGSSWEPIWDAMAVGAPRSRSYADFIQLLAAAHGRAALRGFSRGLVASDDFGSSWRSRWGTPEPVALAASPADPEHGLRVPVERRLGARYPQHDAGHPADNGWRAVLGGPGAVHAARNGPGRSAQRIHGVRRWRAHGLSQHGWGKDV